MEKTVIYFYENNPNLPIISEQLLEMGFDIAVSYDINHKNDNFIVVPKDTISNSGNICIGLWHINKMFKVVDIITADRHATLTEITDVHKIMQKKPNTTIVASRVNPNGDNRFEHISYKIIKKLFSFVQGNSVADLYSGVRGIPWKYLPFFYNMASSDRDFLLKQLIVLKQKNLDVYEYKSEVMHNSIGLHRRRDLITDILRVSKLFLTFASSSTISAIVDWSIYSSLLGFAGLPLFYASSIARLISLTVNFTLNKKFVFQNSSKMKGTLRMFSTYVGLAIPLWTVDFLTLKLFVEVLGANQYISKIIIGAMLYLISYFVQRELIFKRKNKKKKQTAILNQE